MSFSEHTHFEQVNRLLEKENDPAAGNEYLSINFKIHMFLSNNRMNKGHVYPKAQMSLFFRGCSVAGLSRRH